MLIGIFYSFFKVFYNNLQICQFFLEKILYINTRGNIKGNNVSLVNFNFKSYTPAVIENNYLFNVPTIKFNTNFIDKQTYYTQNTNTSAKRNKTSNLHNPKELETSGYDARAGEKLALIAKKNATGFNGQCATSVKHAIQNAGLGAYETGDAYECADILKRNKNFKEISTAGLDLSSLPAGCILVYDRGVAGYSSRYGHTEITLGNGQAVSDGITNNIRQGARVFVPVSNEYLA